MKVFLGVLLLVLVFCKGTFSRCTVSKTTVSGTKAPRGTICSGALIFEDNFDTLDHNKWQHATTLSGGGNWEFQWYLNNRNNSFVDNGILHLRPTMTADAIGEGGLSSANIKLDGCTELAFYGCERQGSPSNIINPIRSAQLITDKSFAFKYGRVEINARISVGDWLWPALWFRPRNRAYGTSPRSGEIGLMEARGNRNLVKGGVNIGPEQFGTTLHFGPDPEHNAFTTAHQLKNSVAGNGWNKKYHRYGMKWTPSEIIFSVDGVAHHTISAGSGFWNRGGFAKTAPGVPNPWRNGTAMAPLDQEFYLLINLAVGGTGYFPDATNPGGKPWRNTSPKAATDFWNGRRQWQPTWKLGSTENHFLIDYVRIWAL